MNHTDLLLWAMCCGCVALLVYCVRLAGQNATNQPRSALCLSCATDAMFRSRREHERSTSFLESAVAEAAIIRKRKWLATSGHKFFWKLLSESSVGNCTSCGRRLENRSNDGDSVDRLQVIVDNVDGHLDAIQRSHRNATLFRGNPLP